MYVEFKQHGYPQRGTRLRKTRRRRTGIYSTQRQGYTQLKNSTTKYRTILYWIEYIRVIFHSLMVKVDLHYYSTYGQQNFLFCTVLPVPLFPQKRPEFICVAYLTYSGLCRIQMEVSRFWSLLLRYYVTTTILVIAADHTIKQKDKRFHCYAFATR